MIAAFLTAVIAGAVSLVAQIVWSVTHERSPFVVRVAGERASAVVAARICVAARIVTVIAATLAVVLWLLHQ